MKLSDLDLRTPLQKERDERNKKILNDYQEVIINLPPDSKKWAIWRAIGERYGLKPQGVRVVLEKMLTVESN